MNDPLNLNREIYADNDQIKRNNYYLESLDRNAVLVAYHGNIPSYALWDERSIMIESIPQRIEWWENYLSKEEEPVSYLARQWINCLTE